MRLAKDGLGVDLPPGWEARAKRQPVERGRQRGNLLLHLCTRAMPVDRGDFGSGAVDLLGPDDVFVSLFEYDPDQAGAELFREQGLPRVRPSDFSDRAMQRVLPGQSGAQYFFSTGGRAFCLYVVLGSHARRAATAAKADRLVRGIDLEAVPA
jgi:hypothetical protein